MSWFCTEDDQKSVASLTRYYSTYYSKPAHTGASGGLLYCVALSHTHLGLLLLNFGAIFPTLPRLQSARRHQPSVEPNEVGLNAKNESNLRKRSGGGHGYVFCKGSRAIGNAVRWARQGWKEIFFELCSLKARFLFPSISWELQQQTPSGAMCFVSASMLWQIRVFVSHVTREGKMVIVKVQQDTVANKGINGCMEALQAEVPTLDFHNQFSSSLFIMRVTIKIVSRYSTNALCLTFK